MKNSIIILLLSISGLNAQFSDAQWYIQQGKYGPNAATLTPMTPLNSTYPLYIYTVQHPGPDLNVMGSYKNTKNDLFIIFNNGDYFNSTDYFKSPGDINVNDQFSAISNASNYKIEFGGTCPYSIGDIKYLYFSNIYEDDDPPALARISQALLTGQPVTKTISIDSYNQNDQILSSNHTVVKGKDYTLIVPKRWDSCNAILLKYPEDLFYFDKLLNPILGADATLLSAGKLVINNPFSNGIKFNFVNFNTASDSRYNDDNFTIDVGCYNQHLDTFTNVETISQSVDTAHDPNFILVKCIEEKKQGSLKYYNVRYHIEFENDGLAPVQQCKLKFTLPASVIPGTLSIKNWYYGGASGCTYSGTKFQRLPTNLPSNLPEVLFVFDKMDTIANYELKSVTSPLSTRRAFVEFCVRINKNSDPTNCDLRPTKCSTSFDGTPYIIDRFIDRDADNILWPNPNVFQRKPVKNCCLNCNEGVSN
ncbi:MAG: hypothetical protein IT264_05695 [Saprospiraceae bacterium]|nr:hypothetical protein [Saprospiraceae bacterium]HRG32136.1 hypothetical protein [Saprospiraceae bacterium]